MTDDQVVEYVKSAQQMGKTQKQITTELMRMGVTKEQVLRIQQKYQGKSDGMGDEMQMDNKSRMRTKKPATSQKKQKQQKLDKDKKTIRSLRTSLIDEEEEPLLPADTLDYWSMGMMEEEKKDPTMQIFGHNVFTNDNLTFEPNINVATPASYRIGPGDEVIIDVWGASETTIREIVSPEGAIQVTGVGPVYLSGKTVKEANNFLRQEFAKIYSGVSGEEPTTQVKLTLGEIRTIQVNVMGEVVVPGTYTLSSFASVFHALYCAGGVNDIGSLRCIKVVRGEKVFALLDVYDLLMQGKMKDDVRLQDGDVILVDTYQSLVRITGKVKRPMFYEMKSDETVGALLKYAGGFTGDAYKKAVTIIRKSGREHQVYNVDDIDFSVFRMDDGDEVSVDSVLSRYENRVEVKGAVYRPGLYQLNGTVNTVKELIKKAEGVRGDAFLGRTVLNREHEDLTTEMLQVDVKGLLNGTAVDIPLQKNDILYIPSIHDLQEEQTLTIHGEVANPGTYAYSKNMTIEDLVIHAGGLLEAAASTKVEVSRRMKNPKSADFSTVIGENFTFDLKDGLLVGNGSETFRLMPFDEVYVRKSPAYFKQQNVTVRGEVLFGGSYALSRKNERLSDLVKKAGGITPDAYVEGARLIRKMTEEEIQRKQDVLKMSNKGRDSIAVDKLDLADTYSVGISLREALNKPGSDADMVLREGDELFVPEYVSTVKINGAVMYPNTVSYRQGADLKYYINQAGGFGDGAKKRKVYVVYLNGTVSRIKKSNSSKIQPGCEIVVPIKDPSKRVSPQEILGIGTTTASLATMIATMVNLFK